MKWFAALLHWVGRRFGKRESKRHEVVPSGTAERRLGHAQSPSTVLEIPRCAQRSESSTAVDDSAGSIEPCATLWLDAISKYERITGDSITLPEPTAASADAFDRYFDEHQSRFAAFRGDRWQWLRDSLMPVVTALQPLCDVAGDAVALGFPPGKIIFSVIGVILKATTALSQDFDAIGNVFQTMAIQLRILQTIPATISDVLRHASVELLCQILVVLSVVRRLQKERRLRAWLEKLRQSDRVSKALDCLGRLATNHHMAVSAATLTTVNKTMIMIAESAEWARGEEDVAGRCLERISAIAQEFDSRYHTFASAEQAQVNQSLLNDMQALVREQSDALRLQWRNTAVEKILLWLPFPDCSPKRNKLNEDRVSETGAWFFRGEEFTSFKARETRALWLHGSGSGKSTLVAAALESLQDENLVTLHHFFDMTNTAHSQDLRALLSSLIGQLAHTFSDCVPSLQRLREEHMHGQTEPATATMRHQIFDILAHQAAQVFLIVDGLDEADDKHLVPFLHDLWTGNNNVSLLVSSRTTVPFAGQLKKFIETELVIRGEGVRADLDILLDAYFGNGGPLEELERRGQAELIRSRLKEKADGNFRWTVLQLNRLVDVASRPHLVQQRLDSLPQTLSESYEQCLLAIKPDDREDAHALLAWAIFARAPLSSRQLGEILFFDHKRMPAFHGSGCRPSPDAAVLLVGSMFLTVYSTRKRVRLSHSSVVEHLLAPSPKSRFHMRPASAHALIARMCISYLREIGVDRALLTPTTTLADDLEYPLERYAAEFWMSHAEEALKSDEKASLEADILDFVYESGDKYWICRQRPVHCAVAGNCFTVLQLFVQAGAYIDARNDFGETPLFTAVERGRLGIASYLLDKGADVKARSILSRTPLAQAASTGNAALVGMLIARGADVHSRDDHPGYTALHHAASSVNEEVVNLLLAKGADPFARDDEGDTPFDLAFEWWRDIEDDNYSDSDQDSSSDEEEDDHYILPRDARIHRVLEALDKKRWATIPHCRPRHRFEVMGPDGTCMELYKYISSGRSPRKLVSDLHVFDA